MSQPLQVAAIPGIPEIRAGDDLATHIAEHASATRWPDGSTGLIDGDIVVITSKVVSKSEGRAVPATESWWRSSSHTENV